MKTLKRLSLLGYAVLALCGSAVQSHAQGFFTLYFDENGNGSWSHGSLVGTSGPGLLPSPGVLLPDPTQAGNPPVLTYFLPLVPGDTVFSGDIRIWDDPGRTILSDVICFTDAAGNIDGSQVADRMIFYSADHLGALADTGIPANLLPNDGGGIVENPDGSFEWAPGGGGNNVYIGLSDVPEPSSFGLMILGGLLGIRRLFWRKQG
jgi:hypothetical protein